MGECEGLTDSIWALVEETNMRVRLTRLILVAGLAVTIGACGGDGGASREAGPWM